MRGVWVLVMSSLWWAMAAVILFQVVLGHAVLDIVARTSVAALVLGGLGLGLTLVWKNYLSLPPAGPEEGKAGRN